MARVRKVELTSEEIKAQITSIEEQITKRNISSVSVFSSLFYFVHFS